MWTSNAVPVACLFQSEAMFLPKIMLIYDKPPLRVTCHYPKGGRLMEVQLNCKEKFQMSCKILGNKYHSAVELPKGVRTDEQTHHRVLFRLKCHSYQHNCVLC